MPIDPKRLLFQDPHLLAVTKLGGELAVAGKGKMQRLPLLDFLKKDIPGLQAVHRLDYETSGVLVFAKSRAVLRKIIESKFLGWRKKYVALVAGHPKQPKGVVVLPLTARSGHGKVQAETAYKILERFHGCALVELVIERGQRHQIRRHMAMLGHPLLLDDLYGDTRANRAFSKATKFRRFFLHAQAISFPHPVSGEPVQINSPLPPQFETVLTKLRGTPRSAR